MPGSLQEGTNEVRLFEHGFVRLDDVMASDLSVVNSARVSFAVRKESMDDRDAGLIRFLMRERHGCYDDDSEVLTHEGWKAWPAVTGEELFATLSCCNALEYQRATRVIHKALRGHMIGFKNDDLDLRVTPDHRVLVSAVTPGETEWERYALAPASSVLFKPHRHKATATWRGREVTAFCFDGARFPALPLLRLVGFFIARGRFAGIPAEPSFSAEEPRELKWLERTAADAGLQLRPGLEGYAVCLTPGLRALFASCRRAGSRVIPRGLLDLSPPLLGAVLEGLLMSESRPLPASGPTTFDTNSKSLADVVQELVLRLGRSASVAPLKGNENRSGSGSGSWRLTIQGRGEPSPALCASAPEADNHMGVEEYSGNIHCVEVPNGTLYVRRNGVPVWCGNTPFEHNSFRFHIRTPIFVAREWMRHRLASVNEESARYHQLEGDFYLPATEAVRTQVGKPGAYSFEPVEAGVAATTLDTMKRIYDEAYAAYRAMVDHGVAKELARAVLPLGVFTQFYWTINARSLMNFLSLRNAAAAQYEIRAYAEAVESLFARAMPITHQAFVDSGRRAP